MRAAGPDRRRSSRTVDPRILPGVMLGVAIAVALATWACGVAPESTPRTVDRANIPLGLADTSTSTTTTTLPETTAQTTVPPATTVPAETAKVYLVQGGNLVAVEREIPVAADLSRIIRDVQVGPSVAERERGLRSAVPFSAVTILGIGLEGGTATIDVAPNFLELLPSPSEQELAAGQLVMTLTDRGPGIGRVRFTVGGTAVPVPRGDGSAPQQPDQSVSRDDYLALVTPPPTG
jgi:Sporulation and spore germination